MQHLELEALEGDWRWTRSSDRVPTIECWHLHKKRDGDAESRASRPWHSPPWDSAREKADRRHVPWTSDLQNHEGQEVFSLQLALLSVLWCHEQKVDTYAHTIVSLFSM